MNSDLAMGSLCEGSLDSRNSLPFLPKKRLQYIEGLRGIAAFVVMEYHAAGMVPSARHLGTWVSATLLQKIFWPFFFGGQMVPLFILVSGFSLYYSESLRRARGSASRFSQFIARRAWRILPVYYVTLALSILMILTIPEMRTHTGTALDTIAPLTQMGILSHIFLVHNLSPDWIYQSNAPLWSIAVEFQLYLLFPVTFFMMSTINPVIAVLLTTAFVRMIMCAIPFKSDSLILFFAFGMFSAHMALRLQARLPWKPILLTGGGLLTAAIAWGPWRVGPLATVLWLGAFCLLMIGLFGAPESKWNFLSGRPVRFLGKISYSLYATHFPLVFLLYALLAKYSHFSRLQTELVMIFAGGALSIVFASIMYKTIEVWSLDKVRAVGEQRLETPQNASS